MNRDQIRDGVEILNPLLLGSLDPGEHRRVLHEAARQRGKRRKLIRLRLRECGFRHRNEMPGDSDLSFFHRQRRSKNRPRSDEHPHRQSGRRDFRYPSPPSATRPPREPREVRPAEDACLSTIPPAILPHPPPEILFAEWPPRKTPRSPRAKILIARQSCRYSPASSRPRTELAKFASRLAKESSGIVNVRFRAGDPHRDWRGLRTVPY